jgi:hypothetical protein
MLSKVDQNARTNAHSLALRGRQTLFLCAPVQFSLQSRGVNTHRCLLTHSTRKPAQYCFRILAEPNALIEPYPRRLSPDWGRRLNVRAGSRDVSKSQIITISWQLLRRLVDTLRIRHH